MFVTLAFLFRFAQLEKTREFFKKKKLIRGFQEYFAGVPLNILEIPRYTSVSFLVH